ncbi:putative viral structural protein [Sulfolobales Beppu filamentous virus 2]|uniref:Putative viral structural protein n=1 Tax=Sulfolobales Beppu filamentous virus 2 TaxID=2493123 RepID=A0A3S8NEU3_9VIRU|nr:putative viral structural protein [Sulfolobales Beppu filamentous virus 2]AZI75786.1 putative viral structural protein [Sulfolobales Beppu filamentous virus 2]
MYGAFENQFFYNLAYEACADKAKVNAYPGYIELILPRSRKSARGLLELLFSRGEKDGVIRVCYHDLCYGKKGIEKATQYYSNVVIYVNFDTGVFNDPHATFICGVPTAKEYWTGKPVAFSQFLTTRQLEERLQELELEPYCERIRPGVYYCPDYFQNRQKLMDCSGKIMVKYSTAEQAEFLYSVFGQDVYMVESISELCKPSTQPISPPLVDFKARPEVPRYLINAIYQYSIPPFRDIAIYMHRRDVVVVVYPDKTFETFKFIKTDQLPPMVEKILKRLVEKRYIEGYCNEVKTLPYTLSVIDELEKLNSTGERCKKWSSGS